MAQMFGWPLQVSRDCVFLIGLPGRGGMGEVYKAEDLNLNQTVALKFLLQRFAEDMAAGESYKIDWPIQPERGCVFWPTRSWLIMICTYYPKVEATLGFET